MTLIEPDTDQVLDFCAREPIERVFLCDVALRGLGRFVAAPNQDGSLAALCYIGANIVPSGVGCDAFAKPAVRADSARMIIGEAGAVGDLWAAIRRHVTPPREDRPHQPVYALSEPPPPGDTALRAATRADLELLLPVCAAAHELELGIDPLAVDPDAFRFRTLAQIEDGRSWLWVEDGVVLFKAEASAWTPSAVQLQQVWTDPQLRGRGLASRGLRDLCRLLLHSTPVVTLFVRSDNVPAIALYDRIGMQRVLEYRSVLLT